MLWTLSALILGGVCTQWGGPVIVGQLDTQIMDEESGLVASRDYPGRLYHIQDSGDGPHFYLTNEQGESTGKVTVTGFDPIDVEDIGLGPCPDQGTCLFLSDIGDNDETRDSLQIVVVREERDYPKKVDPVAKIRLKYPDGPHNAESFAVHPRTGDWFLITKEIHKKESRSYPARIFRVTRATWQAHLQESSRKAIRLEEVGQIDLPALAPQDEFWQQGATAMDISPDGTRFLLLTYKGAYEFRWDLSAGPLPPTGLLREGVDFVRIPLKALPQQEAIGYSADGSSFFYSSESREGSKAPLAKVSCLNF